MDVEKSKEQPQLSSHLRERWQFVEYRHLIKARSNFIVYIDKELDLEWKTSDKFDEENQANDVEYAKITNRAAALEAADRDTSDEKRTLNFKRQIGEAIARGLEGHFESAHEMLEVAEKCLQDELKLRREAIAEHVKVKESWRMARKFWTVAHYLLGVAALVFSSLSASKASDLGLSDAVTAWCAWLTVIFTAMLTFLSPERKSNRYARAWSILNNQIVRYRTDFKVQLKDVIDSYNQGENILFETDTNRRVSD
jgi:hypothetical protein